MTEQSRSERGRYLDEVEAIIASEGVEDAARPDDEPHEPIKNHEGWPGIGGTPRGLSECEETVDG